MREHDLIRSIAGAFPRSIRQDNDLFECDAEIVRFGDEVWGLTMDEFSPREDLFTSEDVVRLGNNLAVATVSDLLAAGVKPELFMHSVSLPRTVRREFVEQLVEGIRVVLDRLDCSLCGGDVGTADPWRFCGFAMGPVKSAKPLTHRLPLEPQTLWVTGTLGDANLAALREMPTPQFELRDREARLLRSCATGCIDTSGGLFDALWLLHEQNPQLRFDIRVNDVPIAGDVPTAADRMGFPMEAALLGGAGEYELLFAVSEASVAAFHDKLRSVGATSIGTVSHGAETGLHLTCRDGRNVRMTESPPCPRNVANVGEHVEEVMEMARRLFGHGGRQ